MTVTATGAPGSLCHRVYLMLDAGHTAGKLGTVYEVALSALMIANVLAVTLASVPDLYAGYGRIFDGFEAFSVAVFTVEYVARLWAAPEDPHGLRRRRPACAMQSIR